MNLPFIRNNVLMIGGRRTVLLAGELHNSSAASLAYVDPLLDHATAFGMNAILAPVSWELLEPVGGEFDFALVDGLVAACRERGLYWVPLWFGTLKNAISCYAPAWVKQDTERFFRAESEPGKPTWAVSVFGEAIAAADSRAFAALLRRLRELDPEGHAVPLVQVENETGMLQAPRDRCPAAETAWEQPVPMALGEGAWEAVYGDRAAESFMAWHVARFVQRVAAAGRAVHDLPMFTNAWQKKGPGYLPGQYPSGGPTHEMLDIWKTAATALDFLAPDIYTSEFREACVRYRRPDNLLAIPEAARGPEAAANCLYAVGRHHALMFAPFGCEDMPADHPLAGVYRQLVAMDDVLTAAFGTERLTAFRLEGDEEEATAVLPGWTFHAQPRGTGDVPPGALLLRDGDDFYALGFNAIITFEAADGPANTELLWLDDGHFQDSTWQSARRLNGDETFHGTGILLGDTLTACRFRLHSY